MTIYLSSNQDKALPPAQSCFICEVENNASKRPKVVSSDHSGIEILIADTHPFATNGRRGQIELIDDHDFAGIFVWGNLAIAHIEKASSQLAIHTHPWICLQCANLDNSTRLHPKPAHTLQIIRSDGKYKKLSRYDLIQSINAELL